MFCANCGKKIDDGSKFCPFCGSPIGGTTQSNEQAQRMSMSSQIPSLSVKKPISKNAVIGMAACLVTVLAVIGVIKLFTGGTREDKLECGLKYEIPNEASDYCGWYSSKTYMFNEDDEPRKRTLRIEVYSREPDPMVKTDTMDWQFDKWERSQKLYCEFNYTNAGGYESCYKVEIEYGIPAYSDVDNEDEEKKAYKMISDVANSIDISDLKYGGY